MNKLMKALTKHAPSKSDVPTTVKGPVKPHVDRKQPAPRKTMKGRDGEC